jgi:ribosomal protein S18 acetylase RimI-like enzyme
MLAAVAIPDRLRPMSLPADLSIRDATTVDLPAIAALREAVGWGVHEWALRAVIGQPHARCVLAVDGGGSLAGVGSGIAYGPLGFVGNMIVAEAHRRRGVGSAILEAVTAYLESAGCRRLELNATSEGRPLYERHGFETIGISATARIPRHVGLADDGDVAVRDATADDLAALLAYDRPRFGGDRRPLLALLLADSHGRTLIAELDSAIAGYAGLRTDPPRIGPFLADEPSIAEALLGRAFASAPAVTELRLNLPPNNAPGAAWLRTLGVEVEPWDGRMGRGPRIPRRDDTVYGMAVGALG